MSFKQITIQRFPNEKNDCVVIAVMLVEGIDYPSAYDKVFYGGRKFRRGTRVGEYVKDKPYDRESLVSNGLPGHKPTLAEVVRTHTTGKYLVCNKNHCMALIDGVIHDTVEPPWRSEVYNLYKWRG